MTIQPGQIAPDFKQDATIGELSPHDYPGSDWGVRFSHPKDLTPVLSRIRGWLINQNLHPLLRHCVRREAIGTIATPPHVEER